MRHCRWCWKMGANRRGLGANRRWFFHAGDCWNAAEMFVGWEREIEPPTMELK